MKEVPSGYLFMADTGKNKEFFYGFSVKKLLK